MKKLIAIMDLDPDYRRQPKTNFFCVLCQRDIKDETARWMHEVDGGGAICHVSDSAHYEATPGDLGAQPVGPHCAKKIPEGYVFD